MSWLSKLFGKREEPRKTDPQKDHALGIITFAIRPHERFAHQPQRMAEEFFAELVRGHAHVIDGHKCSTKIFSDGVVAFFLVMKPAPLSECQDFGKYARKCAKNYGTVVDET